MKARRDRVLTLIARTSRFIPSRVMKERLQSPYGRGVNSTTHRGAAAYAARAGKELPTEAQRSARWPRKQDLLLGGRVRPRGKMMANTWQCEFSWQNQMLDGYEGASPVKRFPPNGYGLFDVAGNAKPQGEQGQRRAPARSRPRLYPSTADGSEGQTKPGGQAQRIAHR